MSRYKAYPEYKDSGVIGDHSHIGVKKVKHIFNRAWPSNFERNFDMVVSVIFSIGH
jgi:hypothetical protein